VRMSLMNARALSPSSARVENEYDSCRPVTSSMVSCRDHDQEGCRTCLPSFLTRSAGLRDVGGSDDAAFNGVGALVGRAPPIRLRRGDVRAH
jgi:hypothetical protein